ncbi:MAG TPA: hypothetical protein VF487_11415 [Chitinophagaceae bacterium]
MTASIISIKTSPLHSVWELRPFVSVLLNSFRPTAIRNGSILVNDIPKDIQIDADRDLLASVLGGLLAHVITIAKDSCIQISAKVYTNVILLHIKDHNTISSISIENNLQLLAEKMGGFVGVSSQRKKLTTIAFSFPNLPVAA